MNVPPLWVWLLAIALFGLPVVGAIIGSTLILGVWVLIVYSLIVTLPLESIFK